ncbi:hypothetical protein ONE63_006832 [Megalurothrips usitatus]|uniref:Uncharacterized protein n=1 Tax=Megalurothrips usitatus TaxID=439358 RepID=A0AAV7XX29_9NEOP|nr:hypothetical protein ONE63_006832 [Megalurothrips usitatus]
MSPLVAGAVIAVSLCLVWATLCVAVHIRRGLKGGGQGRGGRGAGDKATPPLGKTAAHARDPADEKDPDIIPAKFDPVIQRPVGNGTLAHGNSVAHGGSVVGARSPAGGQQHPPLAGLTGSPMGPGPGPGHGMVTGNGGAAAVRGTSPEHWVRNKRNSAGFETVTHHFADPGSTYSWDLRPKDLRLSTSPSSGVGEKRDLELNGTAIKERLMSSRVPESCV